MAQKALENWDRLFQLFAGRSGGIVTKSVYLRREGTYYGVLDGENGQETVKVPAPMGEFALSLLDIEGELECPPATLALSEDAGWALFALVDLARRTHCKSLMNGTPEADLTTDPMRVVEALEQELFPGVDDMRFLTPFLSVTLGARAHPDVKKARQDLIAAEFLNKSGNMTREGSALLRAFTETHAMLGVYGQKKDEGQTTLCCGAMLNCYHSAWSITLDSTEKTFYLTTMSRKELGKTLEKVFS